MLNILAVYASSLEILLLAPKWNLGGIKPWCSSQLIPRCCRVFSSDFSSVFRWIPARSPGRLVWHYQVEVPLNPRPFYQPCGLPYGQKSCQCPHPAWPKLSPALVALCAAWRNWWRQAVESDSRAPKPSVLESLEYFGIIFEIFLLICSKNKTQTHDQTMIWQSYHSVDFAFSLSKLKMIFFTNTLTVLLCYPRQDPAKPSALTQSPSSVALFTAVSKAWKVPGWGLFKCWPSAASADVAPGSNIRILWCLGGNPGLACTGQAVLLLQKLVLEPPGLARIDPQIMFDFEGEKLDMLKYQSRATTMLEATRKRLRTTRGTQSNHRNSRNIFPTETEPNFKHCHPSMKLVDLNGDIVQNCM